MATRRRIFPAWSVNNASLLIGLALGVMAWVLSMTASTFWRDRQPPVVVHTAAFTRETAMPGETVLVEIDRTRNRYCPSVVNEFWRSGDELYQGRIRPGAPSKRLGRYTTQFLKQIPEDLYAGRWCYAPMIVYTCARGTPHMVQQPEACIMVTE